LYCNLWIQFNTTLLQEIDLIRFSDSISTRTGFLKEAGLTPLAASHLHGGSSVSLPGDFHFDGHSPPPATGATSNALPGHNNVSGQEGAHLDCERRYAALMCTLLPKSFIIIIVRMTFNRLSTVGRLDRFLRIIILI